MLLFVYLWNFLSSVCSNTSPILYLSENVFKDQCYCFLWGNWLTKESHVLFCFFLLQYLFYFIQLDKVVFLRQKIKMRGISITLKALFFLLQYIYLERGGALVFSYAAWISTAMFIYKHNNTLLKLLIPIQYLLNFFKSWAYIITYWKCICHFLDVPRDALGIQMLE